MNEAKLPIIFLVVFASIALLASCAMFSGRETAGQYVDDSTITSKVKGDIFEDPALKILQINVETMQGVVQLSGFVDSQTSESKAVTIARHVQGVKSVKDDLIVR
ncbi:MAG: BON domain-containing protein [Alphaproteobacteria bacterium]|nr:BON domain-containing protein [Alphaproteobacteria bacterium]